MELPILLIILAQQTLQPSAVLHVLPKPHDELCVYVDTYLLTRHVSFQIKFVLETTEINQLSCSRKVQLHCLNGMKCGAQCLGAFIFHFQACIQRLLCFLNSSSFRVVHHRLKLLMHYSLMCFFSR